MDCQGEPNGPKRRTCVIRGMIQDGWTFRFRSFPLWEFIPILWSPAQATARLRNFNWATSHLYGCGNQSNGRGESIERKKKNLELEICAKEIWARRVLRLRSLQLTGTPSAPLAGKKWSKPSWGFISRSSSSTSAEPRSTSLPFFRTKNMLLWRTHPAPACAGWKETCILFLVFLRVCSRQCGQSI